MTDTGNDAQRAATQQNEPAKCPTCKRPEYCEICHFSTEHFLGCVCRKHPPIQCPDDWHRQPAAPETAEPSTLINDSRIKHSPLFCGSRYCAQHRDIWHHFETVISRENAAPPADSYCPICSGDNCPWYRSSGSIKQHDSSRKIAAPPEGGTVILSSAASMPDEIMPTTAPEGEANVAP